MQMESWNDLGHAQTDVGNMEIETMLGKSMQKPMGVELRLADWVSLRAEWISQHEQYCIRRADDVEWFRTLVRQARENKVESRVMVEEAN